MKKGQAFDTMMLVIGVIVAVAILAILLNILHIIQLPGNDAKSEIRALMSKVYTNGVGIESKDNVKFSNTDAIFKADAIGSLPIAIKDISFVCISGESCSAETDPVTVTSSSIVGKQAIDMAVAVCINSQTETYLIAVGQRLSAVRDGAASLCGLS
ncbi:MAG: hypothetical protein WC408_03680 [Candidatus Micrarchaeia archaeon]